MIRPNLRRARAALAAICLTALAALTAPAPVAAMQILEAVDHAELAAEISATHVNRIALMGDRIARLVRAPDGFAVEHDAASGDLYLRPVGEGFAEGEPVTLFIGTEKGFTYRLTLTPADRESAQILIRNAGAVGGTAAARPSAADTHIAGLVRLVRAVARRELLPGYEIRTGDYSTGPGLTLVETWRGPRLAALVFEAARPASPGSGPGQAPGSSSGARDDADGSADLAGTIEQMLAAGRVAALWLAAPGTGPGGGRLAVAVVQTAPAGDPR